jgi:hypothetical protein
MTNTKRFIVFLFTVIIGIPATIYSAGDCRPTNPNYHQRHRDWEALQDFVNSKRTIPYAEKQDRLEISGDVRFETTHRTETAMGHALRGWPSTTKVTDRDLPLSQKTGVPIPKYTYGVVLNLLVDYEQEEEVTWAQLKIQYENSAGTEFNPNLCHCPSNPSNTSPYCDPQGLYGSGTCDQLCTKICYFGYNVWDRKEYDFLDLEIGRRQMNKIFDSRIQFKSRFDGILLNYSRLFKPDWKIYIEGGPFVIDFRAGHYGIVAEMGTLDFFESGVDLKYSIIDWMKHGENRCFVNNPRGARFVVSQWTAAYNFKKDNFVLHRKARIYGAFLTNFAAPRTIATFYKRQNIGWYIGFLVGDVKKKGDWSVDMNFQVVQAQAIPDPDVNGISRGNVLKQSFTETQNGRTNYKGWHFETLYAITDDLNLDVTYEFSNAYNGKIGGSHTYHKAEVDFILEF